MAQTRRSIAPAPRITTNVSFSATTRVKRYSVLEPPHASYLYLAKYSQPSQDLLAPVSKPSESPSRLSASFANAWLSLASAVASTTIYSAIVHPFTLNAKEGEEAPASPIHILRDEVRSAEKCKSSIGKMTAFIDGIAYNLEELQADMFDINQQITAAAEELLEVQELIEETNELMREKHGKSISLSIASLVST